MTEIAARLVRPIQRLDRWQFFSILLALLVAAAGLLVLVRAYALREAVLPGVSVAAVDVGGLSRTDAQARIERVIGARLAKPVQIQVGERSFATTPVSVLELDVEATERRAFEAARSSFLDRLGAVVAPFVIEQAVEPVFRIRPEGRDRLSAALAELVPRPVSARVEMRGTEPAVRTGSAGLAVDEAALIEALGAAALSGSSRVVADLTRVEPQIATAEARSAAADAEQVVSAPVTVKFKGAKRGTLDPEQLAEAIRFQPANGALEVVLAGEPLARELRPLVAGKTREPIDATFRVNGKRARVVPAKNGTALAVKKASASVLAAGLLETERTATLELGWVKPELTTLEARALGIRKQLTTYTTEMGPSSANRIWNVHLMADYIDGTIVKPGKTFSFNGIVGPRTVERGFREGQMIVGSLLLPAIGGGVCQTATTLFNNAFELGLPIVERHNHSWYISHYPIGRDATVSYGGPDFVFKNDLKRAILIKTSYTDSTLTFSFYGTNQRRRVVSSTGPQTNFRSPTTSYAVDPAAPPGSVRTVGGSHASGFDITVFRKVFDRGKLLRKDSFTSSYIAVGDTIIYGPGQTPPGPYFVLPSV